MIVLNLDESLVFRRKIWILGFSFLPLFLTFLMTGIRFFDVLSNGLMKNPFLISNVLDNLFYKDYKSEFEYKTVRALNVVDLLYISCS